MATTLQAGDKAPSFSGIDQNGNKISLRDFKGKKLVLYFYPQDGTPTCTVQACNLRDNYTQLQKAGYALVGVSPDEVKKHKNFEAKHALPFTLLADTKLEILEKYGVWGEKMLYGRKYMGVIRTTFLIDEKGKIERVILKPKSKDHAAEILSGNPQ